MEPITAAYFTVATANLGFSMLGKGLSAIGKGASNAWHFFRKSKEEEERRRQEFQEKLQGRSQEFQEKLERSRQEIAYAQMQQQYILQQQRKEFDAGQAVLNREFQAEQNELSRDFQVKFEAYKQEFDLYKFEKRLDFEKSLAEERRKLDIELQQKSQQFSVDMAFLQADLNRETESYRRLLDKFPLQVPHDTFIRDYVRYQNGDVPVPPMILVSPPDLTFEKNQSISSAGLPKEVKGIAKSIEESVRIFLGSSYSDEYRSARYYGGAWESKKSSGETAVAILHAVFSNIPTIILESEAEGEILNFRVYFWDMDQTDFSRVAILSEFNHKDFIVEVEKRRAQAWQGERARLLAKGYSPEEITQIGGDREFNLQQLAKERRYQEDGVSFEVPYKITPEGIEELPKFLKLMHRLSCGLVLDAYYLMRYRQYPRLPKLIGELISGLSQEDAKFLIDIVADHHRVLCKNLEINELHDLVQNVALRFAVQLASLPNGIGIQTAKEFLCLGITSWLGLTSLNLDENLLIEKVREKLTFLDIEFSQQLNECLTALSSKSLLDVESACLNRGIARLEKGEIELALTDFEQVIYLNSNSTDGLYQRGVTYLRLETEESLPKALIDLERLVVLKPDFAEVYELIGDTFYKLGNYVEAIAQYDRAVALGLDSAILKRDLAKGLCDEINRRNEQEKKQKSDLAEQHILKGDEYFAAKSYETALQEYAEASKLGFLVSPERYKSATELLREQREREELAKGHVLEGDRYFASREFDSALNEYREAISLGLVAATEKADQTRELSLIVSEVVELAKKHSLNRDEYMNNDNFIYALIEYSKVGELGLVLNNLYHLELVDPIEIRNKFEEMLQEDVGNIEKNINQRTDFLASKEYYLAFEETDRILEFFTNNGFLIELAIASQMEVNPHDIARRFLDMEVIQIIGNLFSVFGETTDMQAVHEINELLSYFDLEKYSEFKEFNDVLKEINDEYNLILKAVAQAMEK